MKKVTVNLFFSKDEFFSRLKEEFPKLKESGGFELLRCSQNCRTLKPLECDWRPECIRQCLGSQSKIYIRPIQNHLETAPQPSNDTNEVLISKCNACNQEMDMTLLRDHIKVCSQSAIDDDDEDLPELSKCNLK